MSNIYGASLAKETQALEFHGCQVTLTARAILEPPDSGDGVVSVAKVEILFPPQVASDGSLFYDPGVHKDFRLGARVLVCGRPMVEEWGHGYQGSHARWAEVVVDVLPCSPTAVKEAVALAFERGRRDVEGLRIAVDARKAAHALLGEVEP